MMRRFFPSTIRQAGGEFDPTSIGNCEIWFDVADDYSITRNGTISFGIDTLDLVQIINDKSGNNRHAEQPTESLRPAISLETLNSKQLIATISTGRFLWTQSDFTISDYPITMFCVSRQQQGVYASYAVPTVNNQRIMFNNLSGTSGNFQVRSGAVQSNTPNTTLIQNDFYINEGIAESATLRRFSVNGGAYSDITTNAVYPNPTRFFLGRSSNQNLIGVADGGRYGEVLMYSKVLTSGERTQVIDYLADKWGITL